MDFRWIEWNINHIGEHGVEPEEAEQVVANVKPPWPLWRPDDKWLVWGAGHGGRLLQVVFVTDDDDTLFIIHARPLTDKEKRRYRRRKK